MMLKQGTLVFTMIFFVTPVVAAAHELTTTDVFSMMDAQLPEDQIIAHVNCNRGTYVLDPKSFVFRYYHSGQPLPENLAAVMAQANARTTAGAPVASDCPVVRTRMLSWKTDIGYSTKTGAGATVAEAIPLKYAYISSNDANVKLRALALLQKQGRYIFVDRPQEAELFIQVLDKNGARTVSGPAGVPGVFAVPLGDKGPYTQTYKSVELTATWFKKGEKTLYSDKETIERRQIYYRVKPNLKAAVASFVAELDAAEAKLSKGNAR